MKSPLVRVALATCHESGEYRESRGKVGGKENNKIIEMRIGNLNRIDR